MQTAALIVRLALALVLIVAAIAKLTDRAGTSEAAVALGVPAPWGPRVARILPGVEVLVVVLLVPASTARVGGLLAVALFAMFTAAIVRTLAQGRAPACNCFGQLSARSISGWTVARNAVLLVAAGVVAVAGGPGLHEWATSHSPDTAAAIIDVLVGALLAGGVAAAVLLARGRPEQGSSEAGPVGLPVGSAAPGFELVDAVGQRRSLEGILEQGRPALLVFTSPTCGPCTELLPDVARWQRSYAPLLSVVPIGSGPQDANLEKSRAHDLDLLVDEAGTAAAAYRYAGTPGAVVVSADGTVASALASGPAGIRQLVARTLADLASEGTVPLGDLVVGEDAPGFTLDTLHGHPVSLSEYAGSLVLLVFWDSTCGYCHGLLPELRRWEAERPAGVHLVVVAIGSEDGLRAQGWQSHVALDPGSLVTKSYGGFGTPTAVLVDARGRVASDLAVGADEVLALAARAEQLARLAQSISSS